MDCKIITRLFFLIFCFLPTHSIAIEFTGKFLQGHFIIGQTEPSAKINFPSSSHGWGTGQMLWCMSAGSSGYLGFSAEL